MQTHKFVRKNGLQLPLNYLQVLAWILAVFEVAFISVFIYSEETLIPCIVLYIVKILLLLLMFLLYFIDPTAKKVEEESGNTVCGICGWTVNLKAKHCGQCNRCTEGFDHHCKWLNNCIGEKNYKLFVVLVVLLNLDKVFLLFFVINSLVRSYSNEQFGLFTGQFLLGTETFCVLGFCLNLLIFHIYLKCSGITTYQYLLRRRDNHRKANKNNTMPKKEFTLTIKVDDSMKSKESI